MITQLTKIPPSDAGANTARKVLMYNNNPAIQYIEYIDCLQRSMYLQENTMVFVEEGTFTVRYGEQEHFIRAGAMALIRKNIIIQGMAGAHNAATVSGQSRRVCRLILVLIQDEIIKEFTTLAKLTSLSNSDPRTVTTSSINEDLLRFLGSLESYLHRPQKAGDMFVKIKILELLFHLAANDEHILRELLDLREHHHNINITTVIEDNMLNGISLRQLARLSGRSLSSFRRDFLAIYNMPPSKWIRQKRLEKACQLLQSTSMSVTDICYMLGFESIAHFSRLFKTYFRYSPSNFRVNPGCVTMTY